MVFSGSLEEFKFWLKQHMAEYRRNEWKAKHMTSKED